MIPLFEKYTADISESDMRAVEIVSQLLSSHRGADNAIDNARIQARLRMAGESASPARVRKLINYIRTRDIVPLLIATSKGYYVSENIAEIREYLESLNGRIKAITSVRDAIDRQINIKPRQLQLW